MLIPKRFEAAFLFGYFLLGKQKKVTIKTRNYKDLIFNNNWAILKFIS
jgi:hypothetical protein